MMAYLSSRGSVSAWRQGGDAFVAATAKPRRGFELRSRGTNAQLSRNLAGASAEGSFAAAGVASASFVGVTLGVGSLAVASAASSGFAGAASATGAFGAAGVATTAFSTGTASVIVSAPGVSTAGFGGASLMSAALVPAQGQASATFDGDSATGSFMTAGGASGVTFDGAAVAVSAMTVAVGSSTSTFAGVGPAPAGDWLMYATEGDMVARFGADEMSMLAEGSDVIQALRDASEEAQSYTAVRYTPPLPNVPAPLVSATCDIARYRLYKDRATEQVKERYEAQVKWLTRIADGKAVLTFNPALTPEEAEVIEKPVTPSSGMATQGVFGDAVLGMMPDVRRGSYW